MTQQYGLAAHTASEVDQVEWLLQPFDETEMRQVEQREPSGHYAPVGMWSIRCLSRAKLARPYMLRLSSLRFVICPSVWPCE
jgi:hypothetical protein